jgi:hypothetical protein
MVGRSVASVNPSAVRLPPHGPYGAEPVLALLVGDEKAAQVAAGPLGGAGLYTQARKRSQAA